MQIRKFNNGRDVNDQRTRQARSQDAFSPTPSSPFSNVSSLYKPGRSPQERRLRPQGMYNDGGMVPQGPDINQLLDFLASYDPNAKVGELLQQLGMLPAASSDPQAGPEMGARAMAPSALEGGAGGAQVEDLLRQLQAQ